MLGEHVRRLKMRLNSWSTLWLLKEISRLYQAPIMAEIRIRQIFKMLELFW